VLPPPAGKFARALQFAPPSWDDTTKSPFEATTMFRPSRDAPMPISLLLQVGVEMIL